MSTRPSSPGGVHTPHGVCPPPASWYSHACILLVSVQLLVSTLFTRSLEFVRLFVDYVIGGCSGRRGSADGAWWRIASSLARTLITWYMRVHHLTPKIKCRECSLFALASKHELTPPESSLATLPAKTPFHQIQTLQGRSSVRAKVRGHGDYASGSSKSPKKHTKTQAESETLSGLLPN